MAYPVLKYIPNVLSIFRLLLIVPFLFFLYNKDYTNAFYIFFLAGFSDGLDGWLARRFHWQSCLGSFIDPLADKLLVASSFISLALIGQLPWWLVLLVFLRDLTISVGVLAWYFFVQKKLDFEPTLISKINTAFQLLLVILCLFELAFVKYSYFVKSLDDLTFLLIILTTITTAATYFHYVWTWGRKAFFENHVMQ